MIKGEVKSSQHIKAGLKRATDAGRDAAYLHYLVVDDYWTHKGKNRPKKHREDTCHCTADCDFGFIDCHGLLLTARSQSLAFVYVRRAKRLHA